MRERRPTLPRRILSATRTIIVITITLIVAGCSYGRSYELRGQIVGVDSARHELTVKHEAIRGFMPGMTMPFNDWQAAELLAEMRRADASR